MSVEQQEAISERLFAGGGEMGALMQAQDWSQTRLGAVEHWSQSLRTAVRIMLTSQQAMFVWWGEDLINLYNDAYRAILGGKHPKALGQPAAEVWREIWDQVGPRAESALRQNEGTYDESLLLIMERNGYPEETYYTFSYSPIPDDDGSTGGIFCANTDDTQRIIGERQLALLTELATKTADARTFDEACTLSATCLATNPYDLPFAMIYLVDPDQQIISLAGTSGITQDAAAVPETVAFNQPSAWRFGEVLSTHQPCLISDLEAQFSHLPTGAWHQSPHQAIAVPIAPSGETGKAGILVAGLNPFRLFDHSYQQFIDLVAAQTAASVANAQAYEEERKRTKALAELDRAKTAFFSNISHEFRTPLTLMLDPLAETLSRLDGQLPPSEREQLQMVQRNGQRLLKLVNTLLDFSRIEAGRIQATYQPTDLATYTIELASVFRSAIERANLRLVVDCSPLSSPAWVDREMWEKIVLNLLSNAFKFTIAGEIAVILREGNNQIELEVRDTGTGIPAAELPRIFERFHRVRGAKGRTYEGSGIGLSLVRELVLLHGGTIEVRSVVDQGSRFIVSIPAGSAHLSPERLDATRALVPVATGTVPYVEEALRWLPEEDFGAPILDFRVEPTRAITDPAHLRRQPDPSQPESRPPTSKILLVDDNTDMRDYVRRLLVDQGHTVETAANGRAAIALLKHLPDPHHLPDLILTDVMMPHLDGFGLLRALRADAATRDLPIILLSARAGEEARIEGLSAGADDYLTKPFSARELLARVEANLKLAQVRRAAMQQEQALRLEAETAQQTVEMILSSISDSFVVLDRDWNFTYVNDRYCKTVEMERDALLGHSVWELFPDAANTDVHIQLQRSLDEQTPVQFEWFFHAWNRWFEYRVYPSPSGLTIFLCEITDRVQVEHERRQTESALHESEERLRLTLAAANQGWYDLNVQTGDTIVSPEYAQMLGYDPATFQETNAKWQERLHPDDRERVSQTYNDYIAGIHSEYRVEFRQRTQSGDWKWILSLGNFVAWDAAGQPLRMLGTHTEITERKQAEEAIRQSESRLRLMIESAKDYAIFTLDLNGTIASWNSGAERLLGYLEIEAIGCSGQMIFTPEDNEQRRPEYEMQTALTQGRAENERWHVRKDGSRFWASGLMMPLLDDADQPQGFVKILQDKTTQRQAGERLRLLYETTSDLLSTDQPLALMHTLFSKLSGQLELDYYYNFMLEEKDGQQRLHLKNHEGISEETAQALEWIGLGEYLCGLVAQERRQLIFDQAQLASHPNAQGICALGVTAYAGQPLIAQGRLLGTLSFASRTRTHFTPEEVEVLQSTCDQVAIALERSNLITSIQQQAEQLRHANRIKDEFLAVLSHELRSPLNPILGWTKMLQSGKLDAAKTTQALATIERNAKLQAELIEDLLDVSRILQGKLRLTIRPVDLRLTVESAIETVSLAAEAKAIEIQTLLEAEVGDVSGDPSRLQQIVWNLVSNAVKFTPSGGRVEVRLSRVDHQAQITVIDTGKGISPEFLPHVFDYFRQADSATTRKFGGLGLGLAIVRHLVELHGGTVGVDSQGEGQGATFTVRLPLLATGDRQGNRAQQSLSSAAAEEPLAGMRVLVVDDEIDMRDVIAFSLEQAGAEVIAVATAAEALVVLAQERPNILLSDIGMPDMDGYMLLRQVRALPLAQGGQTPAIALTAYAGEVDQQQALHAGFQQHLAKPVEPDVLVRAIAQALA
ncbi:ATP-binding protein [Myxacorys almedinensis]|uniref:Circadian input-output histidine kinase CikA n=1 Tax=Myxacorys almedinensis A TaxID=2690445 RepID=A0A8J7Z8P8_9CYAN|nr:ATP-binding protein [Myxacorys almedinensis]NDJ17490.1 response regulator [Myxacorys almedinensis A]